jgi:hypothetical protein
MTYNEKMEIEKPNPFSHYLEKNYMRGRRTAFRLWKKISGRTRPSSYPYVSGDSFRALADHIHDETGTFDPTQVKTGDVVFVSNPLTLSYLKEVHPKIKNPYILIEHNGDFSIDEEYVRLLDDKIIRFYAQDVICDHPKIICIPLALENLHYYVNGIPSLLEKFRRKIRQHPPQRKNRIFYQFNVGTNPGERGPALAYFSANPLMDSVNAHLSPRFHWQILSQYKFVASPPGNAVESSRTWEALYLKTIPIVKDIACMRSFAEIGVPLWIVKDWKELEEYDEVKLAEKYDVLLSKANWEPLFMDFWIDMIRRDQVQLRSKQQ